MGYSFSKSFWGVQILALLFFSCTQNQAGKGQEEVKASDIIKIINEGKDVNLNDAVITGTLDFTQVSNKVILNSGLSQCEIKTSVSFTKCRFSGNVFCSKREKDSGLQSFFAQDLIMNACTFDSVADFQSATIIGNVSFVGSTFKGQALFNNFYAHSKAAFFGQITAEKDFSMQDALFTGSCSFVKAKFKSSVSFQGSRFDGAFVFNTVQCDSRSDFSKVRFNNNCAFNYTTFSGLARFNQLRVLGMSEFLQTNFGNDAIFTNALFFDISKFNEAKIAGVFDFTSSVFYNGAPMMNKIEIAKPDLYKTASILQHEAFVVPKMEDK
jgi:hypothetical protein